jgi:hypothetical protein
MGFGYRQIKVHRYVEVGPETYRRPDFLHPPDADMSEEDRAVVLHNMSQLVKGIGTTPDRPFIGLGIRGLSDMAHTLYLEGLGQEIVGSVEGALLDRMSCQHIVMSEVMDLPLSLSPPLRGGHDLHLVN